VSAPAELDDHSDRGVSTPQPPTSSVWPRSAPPSACRPRTYDNAKAESFFKTLKREEVELNQYETFADAEAQLGRFVDDVYNLKRLHSSLGYLPPVEYESLYNAKREHPLSVVR
jgi:transposase InsO family protein